MTTPHRELAHPPGNSNASLPGARLYLRLLLVSIAGLYLEIVLIRWIGTEVRVFAYVQNLALIACFLGFGIGCFGARNRTSLMPSLVAVTALVAVVTMPLQPWQAVLNSLSTWLTMSPDAALWGPFAEFSRGTRLRLLVTSAGVLASLLMIMVIAMVPVGQWVAFYLSSAPNVVRAYSVNLAGSIVGLWLLALVSFAWLSPSYWFAIAYALLLVAQPLPWRQILLGLCMLCVALLFLGLAVPGGWVQWSPYQKLTIRPLGEEQYQIEVNNTGYMSVANATPAHLAAHPELAAALPDSSYESPFRFAARMDRVLVVGAGAGNDVAAALRHGAGHVDAVEIDPLIFSLGERLHPERPYQSRRVRRIINDARNHMRLARESYDVIVFGLLDSHTEFSGYSNMRVDNYVYTEEAFQEARRLLAPDGLLVVKFEVRRPWTWMGQRFYALLDKVFGRPPITYFAPGQGAFLSATVFLESGSSQFWERAARPPARTFLAAHPVAFPLTSAGAPPLTTDDWPYVYHRDRSIPGTYLLASLVVLAMALFMVREFFRPREAVTWHFFFLGAGFLLLETQWISRLALYFGATWIVNSIAITIILSVLVAANLFVERWPQRRLQPYFVVLLVALLANYAIPWQQLPGSPALVGLLLSAMFSVPVFCAGVIFAESFRNSGQRTDAFGANIIGAVAGGVAHNLSFIFGMKALLLVACLLYAGSAVLSIRRPRLATSR